MTARRPVFLIESRVATALGDSLEALWQRLLAGDSAVRPIRRFDTARLQHGVGACAGGLADEAREGENLTQALMRRALAGMGSPPHDTPLYWTGVKGDAEFIEVRAREGQGWGPWLPAHYRVWLGELLGLGKARGMEINAACASSTVGMALAAEAIATGAADRVLVCAADVVSRFTHVGFSALKALSPEACRPFDADRDGLALGDGAAAVLLGCEAAARERGADEVVRIAGWGIANDANHITGPARDGCGLVRAIESALGQAELAPDEIEAFCAHGTGTVYNDAMELTALERVFGTRRFPVFSIKGAIGHTLGAAGAIESAVCARALGEKHVPPTAGLASPEERAEGRASAQAQAFGGKNILTSNSGFGGVNAALVLSRGE